MSNITMKNLLEAGVHFGHQTRKWNPKMGKYIFGARNNIHILDLQKTVKCLKSAYNFLKDEASTGKSFLFVGTKRQAQDAIKEEAERCEMYFVNYRWLGGCLTNFSTIKNSVKRLKYLEELKSSPTWEKLSKKEVARLTKEYGKLDKALCGIKNMKKLPEIAVIIDPEQELTAVKECRKLKIPIVSVIDTNCDPDLIDVGVPGNDDAIRAIKLFLSIFADAINEGKEIYSKIGSKQDEKGEETEELSAVPNMALDVDSEEEVKNIAAIKAHKITNKKEETKVKKVVKKKKIEEDEE